MKIVHEAIGAFDQAIWTKHDRYQRGRLQMAIFSISAITKIPTTKVEKYIKEMWGRRKDGSPIDNPLQWQARGGKEGPARNRRRTEG